MAREKQRAGIWDFLKWFVGAIVILAIFCMTFGMINLRQKRESC